MSTVLTALWLWIEMSFPKTRKNCRTAFSTISRGGIRSMIFHLWVGHGSLESMKFLHGDYEPMSTLRTICRLDE